MKDVWKTYAGFYRGLWKSMALSFALSVTQPLLLLPIALLVRKIFDQVLAKGDSSMLVRLALGILGLYAFHGAVQLCNRGLTLKITKIAIQRFRSELIEKIYRVDKQERMRADPERLHTVIVQDTERLDIMTNALISQLIPGAVVSLGLSAILCYLNARMFLVLVALGPVLVAVSKLLGRRVNERVRRFRWSFEDFSRQTRFALEKMDLIRLHSAEEREKTRQHGAARELRLSSGRMAWLDTAYGLLQNMGVMAAGTVILIVGGMAVIRKQMTVGDLLSFYVAVDLLKDQLRVIFNAVPNFLAGLQSMRALADILSLPEKAEHPSGKKLTFTGRLKAEGLSFGYGRAPVLEGVSFELQPFRCVALAGSSGAGKSTLLQLIFGFYEPKAGRLLAEGIPYAEWDLSHLRRQVGVVLQDPLIFRGTLRENIAYGMEEAGDEEIRAAAEGAMAHGFISRLPDGYDTLVGEGGQFLSGGEAQRINIARALIRKPKLLVLDEPTNHLDGNLVEALVRNLQRQKDEMSVLLVSHDERVLKIADQVLWLENGKLREAEWKSGELRYG
ncbi:MAG: ABC transporter ATP-binding protein [bacterium]